MCMVIKKKKGIQIVLFTILFMALSTFILPFWGRDGCETNKKNYDVIIVLGAPATNECQPSLMMQQRVSKGIELYKNGLASKIIFTGSSVANNCVEANVMYEYAVSNGVIDSTIFVEPKARNTYQNAFFSVEIMRKQKFKSAAIVTSEFHRKRASAIFSNYNIEYQLYPCINPPIGIKYFVWRIRENLILSFHTIMGYPLKFGM